MGTPLEPHEQNAWLSVQKAGLEMLTLMRTHIPGNVRMLSVSVTAGMCKPCVARFLAYKQRDRSLPASRLSPVLEWSLSFFLMCALSLSLNGSTTGRAGVASP